MTPIYSIHQKTAGDNIILSFTEAIPKIRWALLFAQMQSGKTTTYLYVACESIRKGLVQKVIIFSGNTELELKNQVNSDCDRFVSNYCLENGIGFIDIRQKINVVWGAELNRRTPEKNALFIWDESHAAQSQGMRPDKFLIANGISGNGDIDKLNKQNNYVLSVSATPFSEISDMVHENQFKTKITLHVGPEYFGLKDMLENNNIRAYTEWKSTLKRALKEHSKSTPKYAIVRVKDDIMANQISRYAEACGWKCLFYNSKVKDIESMNDLETAPSVNTLIVIKGMCRMGKVVPKQHIAFCMETSNSPNTDVVLQGLLGRMMGWNANRNVIIYLNEAVFSFNELESYVQLYEGEEIIPSHATNVLSRNYHNESELYPIIPIRIRPSDRIVDGSLDDIDARERYATIESVRAALRDGRFENYNDDEQLNEIRENIQRFDDSQFEIRYQCATLEGVEERILESISQQVPKKLGSSAGIAADGSEIKIYKFGRNWYIDARTQTCSKKYAEILKLQKNIPKTTKKEVFCRHEESGIEVMENGGNVISLPIETCTNIDAMRLSIFDFINISLMQTNMLSIKRSITSIQSDSWKGICVSDDVFEALKKNGAIYNAVKLEYGFKLRTRKASGRKSKELIRLGMTRLEKISW